MSSKIEAQPHVSMSPKGPRFSRAYRAQEEGSGGPVDGGTQGGDEADGQAVPKASKALKGRMLDELCALTG